MTEKLPPAPHATFAERVAELERGVTDYLCGDYIDLNKRNLETIRGVIACVREQQAALKAVLPVADETCKQWPNDDCFLMPTMQARATLAKWVLP